MKVLDLFSGIGGFSIGLERAGFETAAFCEIEPFCQKVLKKHWPDVPIYSDIRSLNGEQFRSIDLVCGGFPCQPFSTAARGRNNTIDLWPEMFRVIKEASPRFIILENVTEKPIKAARKQLEFIGYRCVSKRISANACGADHGRSRWWLCAYADSESKLYSAINAEMAELPELCQGVWGAENYARAFRISNGVSDRMDRIRSLGNAVLPQIPEIFGRAIMEHEKIHT